MFNMMYQYKYAEEQVEYIYLKITGKLIPENIKLKRNILWEIIEIDWKEVNIVKVQSGFYGVKV